MAAKGGASEGGKSPKTPGFPGFFFVRLQLAVFLYGYTYISIVGNPKTNKMGCKMIFVYKDDFGV